MRKIAYVCDICGKEATKDKPVYNLIWQEQTDDGSDGDLDPVVDGVSTIDVCGVCALKVGLAIRPVISHMTQRTAENSSIKPQQKKDCKFTASLQQDQSTDTKPVEKGTKPVKKVTAGRGKRKTVDAGKLIALHKAGWTPEKIADELSCHVATVYNYLRKAKEEGKI